MGQRTVGEVMMEGQKLTLEHLELARKELRGEVLTEQEKTRKVQLESYLVGLVGEAQAMGVGLAVGGVGVGAEAEDEGSEDEDFFALDNEDEDEPSQEERRSGDPFGGYGRW